MYCISSYSFFFFFFVVPIHCLCFSRALIVLAVCWISSNFAVHFQRSFCLLQFPVSHFSVLYIKLQVAQGSDCQLLGNGTMETFESVIQMVKYTQGSSEGGPVEMLSINLSSLDRI